MDTYVKATSILFDMGMNTTLGVTKDMIQLVRERANTLRSKNSTCCQERRKREVRNEDQTSYANHDRESTNSTKTVR
jgi:DNA-binding protein H-NS